MKLYMYGLGPDKKASARLLKQLGFSGVMGGWETVLSAMEEGLEGYAVSGAFRGPLFEGDSYLAEDIFGRKQRWFSSTCPTREEVRAYNLSQIGELARIPGLSGVLIDGARFASLSSSDTPDAFFTCFCPSCMKRAEELGFSPSLMKEGAETLYKLCHGEKMRFLSVERALRRGVSEWMRFREASVTEHLAAFSKCVKTVRADLEAGIFIFAPALSSLVGQSYRGLLPYMDLYSPMLYRSYLEENGKGAACLNYELADISALLGGMPLPAFLKEKLYKELTGYADFQEIHSPEDYEAAVRKGFPPELLRSETQRAAGEVPGKRLMPIIQLQDESLEASIENARLGGARELSFFLYQEEEILHQADVLAKAAV